jgi:DNA-binding beta-propeller fold protein YncE
VGANEIAIAPDGATLYATGPLGVTPVDVRTHSVGALIPVPLGADGIALTPDGSYAFVTSAFGQDTYGWVTPIHLADRAVGQRIRVPAGATALAVTPNGRTVYVASDFDGAVTPVDVKTRTAGRSIPVDIDADTIAIAPSGKKAYVGTIDSVEVIDLTTGAVVGALQGGWVDFPNAGLAITPDGATAFVSDDESTGGSFVQAFTIRTGAPGKIISKAGPGGIAITPAQAPTARFTATAAPAGTRTRFDGSRSSPGTGSIVRYAWRFGDGTGAVTTTPLASHVYPIPGSYTVSLQVTNSAETSIWRVFTGQTMSRNGRPRARHAQRVVIP